MFQKSQFNKEMEINLLILLENVTEVELKSEFCSHLKLGYQKMVPHPEVKIKIMKPTRKVPSQGF